MAKVSENRERFIRIAGPRVQKIIDQLDTLGNCANEAQYEYGDADIEKINKALTKALERLMSKLAHDSGGGFSFNEED